MSDLEEERLFHEAIFILQNIRGVIVVTTTNFNVRKGAVLTTTIDSTGTHIQVYLEIGIIPPILEVSLGCWSLGG